MKSLKSLIVALCTFVAPFGAYAQDAQVQAGYDLPRGQGRVTSFACTTPDANGQLTPGCGGGTSSGVVAPGTTPTKTQSVQGSGPSALPVTTQNLEPVYMLLGTFGGAGSTTTGSAVGPVYGGSYLLSISGTFNGASAQLQSLAADGVTWTNVGSPFTAAAVNAYAVGSSTISSTTPNIRMLVTGSGYTLWANLSWTAAQPAPSVPISVQNLDGTALNAAATSYSYAALATTNLTSVTTVKTTVLSVTVCNNTSSLRYFRLYDKASAPVPASDVPKFRTSAASNSGCIIVWNLPNGFVLTNGLAFDVTAGVADTDTTATTANDVFVNLGYR